MRAAALIVMVALSGCQSTAKVEQDKQAYLNSTYRGRALSDFMLTNGLTPYNAFDMPGGKRVFLFDVPCRSWWLTRAAGQNNSPADFIVENVEIRGYCG